MAITGNCLRIIAYRASGEQCSRIQILLTRWLVRFHQVILEALIFNDFNTMTALLAFNIPLPVSYIHYQLY